MENFLCALGAFIAGSLPGAAVLLYVLWRKRREVTATAPTMPAAPARASVADLPRLIERALDQQREDRDMRLANTAYWGDTGYWVALAVRDAEAVLQDVPVTGDPRAWLQSRRELLAKVHERFRRDADDPDGFGSATFHEVLRALEEIGVLVEETDP